MKSVHYTISLLLLFSFAIPISGYAQDVLRSLPSATLEQMLKVHPRQDTAYVNLLNDLAWNANSNKQRDSALQVVLRLSDSLHYHKGKAVALTTRAWNTYSDTLIFLAKDAIAEAKRSGDSALIFWVYRKVGNAMAYNQSVGADAMSVLQQGFRLAKASHDITFLTGTTINLSAYYSQNQFNYPLAIQWALQAVQTASHSKQIQDQAEAYQNLGAVYKLNGNHKSAIQNLKRAVDVYRKIGNQGSASFLLQDIGDEYKYEKQYPEALQAYTEGLSFREDKLFLAMSETGCADAYYHMNNDSLASVYAFAALSDVNTLKDSYSVLHSQIDDIISRTHLRRHHIDSALYYAREAYRYSLIFNFWERVRNSSEALSDAYAAKKDYTNAYKYYKIFIAARDSVISEETVTKSKLQQNDYELSRQQSQIQVLNKNRQLQQEQATRQRYFLISALSALALIVVILFLLYRNNRQKQKANLLLQEQKAEIQRQRDQTNNALAELKSTQAQLIQSEKMASLGELTAGIAHEIQNPLNFVNNFSEVNREMVDEATEEMEKGNVEEVRNILSDIKDNSEKISHHGKRADAIVKGMLQHSRQSKGKKEATNINAICDEYLQLSYHGLRAKDKSFNADFTTDFDESIGNLNIVSQDMGRVLLNLFNNAFYAVNEKRKTSDESYKPLVSVHTKKNRDKVEIKVEDNGNGIPQSVIDKIFQPFFTPKPTGLGTGLGLSLSYDIVAKEHSGTLKVESTEGEGSIFRIIIPV